MLHEMIKMIGSDAWQFGYICGAVIVGGLAMCAHYLEVL